MDKKLLVFSIFVSLFILGGLKFADAVVTTPAANNTVLGTSYIVAVSFGAADFGDGAGALNSRNLTIYYNATGANTWTKASLSGITGNTTCTSNVCKNATGEQNAFKFTLTVSGVTDVKHVQLRIRNNVSVALTHRNFTKQVDIDNTAPTVTLVGNATDGFVFLSASRLGQNFHPFAYRMFGRVSDPHGLNCSLYTDANLASKGTALRAVQNLGQAKTGVNGTVSNVAFFNASLNWTILSNTQFRWGATCRDNATTANVGVASTNFTFYFDNTSPKMAATNPLTFEDSDPNAKDTSTSGLFRIGGVWTSELLETLTFTCDVTEANLVNVKFLIKRPGSTVFDLEKLSTKKTLEFTDTSKTGIYEIKCITTDIAGNATTSTTAKFRLQSEDEGEVPGTPAYVKPFNVDFSKTDSKNIVEPAGRILTVTFDGKTEHTVNFQKVTATSVTLIITSTPKTLNLNVGDTKNVDVNDDGVDDFAVSLIGIIEGKANVNFKKLSGAAAVAREESGGTATTVSGGTGPATSGRSTTGIWIVVLIVVVGVIIYLVVARRKKK